MLQKIKHLAIAVGLAAATAAVTTVEGDAAIFGDTWSPIVVGLCSVAAMEINDYQNRT